MLTVPARGSASRTLGHGFNGRNRRDSAAGPGAGEGWLSTQLGTFNLAKIPAEFTTYALASRVKARITAIRRDATAF